MAAPSFTAGEALGKNVAVYIDASDGEAYITDISDPDKPYMFLTAEAVESGACTMLDFGKQYDAGWSWTPGPIWVAADGSMTQTKPSGNYRQQVCAIAVAADTVNLLTPDTEPNLVNVSNAGTWVGNRPELNYIAGSNVTLGVVDNSTDNRTDITITATGGTGSGLNSYYDVTDYGASPLGSIDATTAIQSAINAASTAGGGIVWFPKGTYKTTTKLVGASNVSLKGAGIGVSNIYTTANTSPHYYAVYLVSKNNITISGLSFYSVNSSSATQFGIWMEGCNNITIENCELYYFYNYGIRPITTVNTNITIRHNYFHHIHSMATPNPANDGTAIVAHYLKNSRIKNNFITLCGCAQNTDHGIYGGNTTDNLKIDSNIIFANYGGNIQIDNSSYTTTNVNITNNIIANASYFGIVIHRITGCNITNNTVLMTGATTEPAIDAYYKYNYDVNISNNVVRSTTTRPLIGLSGNRITANNNVLYGNGNASSIGITVGRDSGASGYVNGIEMINNRINNVGKGITVAAISRRVQAVMNTIETATTGIELVSGSDYSRLTGNLFYDVSTNVSKSGATNVTDDDGIDW